MFKFSIAIALGLISAPVQAQWIHQPTPGIPRTADGMPDLKAPAPTAADGKADFSGLWILLPGKGGISQLKPSEIKPWAETLHKERRENLGSDDPSIHCLPGGFIGAGLTKIVQTPALIVVLSEDLTYRQIFLDGRELPKDPNPAWMGYSVGHWEGDTLVVESTGYNDRTWLGEGYPHSENLRIKERWRRADFGHLAMDMEFSDPSIYSRPFTVAVAGTYSADTDLLEYVCAENEKDRSHLVGKNSDDAKRAIKLAPEILAKYTGTYLLGGDIAKDVGAEFIPVTIALEDGGLKLGIADGERQPMLALSEVTFTGFGGYIDFGKNDKGEVDHIVVRLAEGDYRANRK
jgi:hypothetical protein